jgi:hypothetical protein
MEQLQPENSRVIPVQLNDLAANAFPLFKPCHCPHIGRQNHMPVHTTAGNGGARLFQMAFIVIVSLAMLRHGLLLFASTAVAATVVTCCYSRMGLFSLTSCSILAKLSKRIWSLAC